MPYSHGGGQGPRDGADDEPLLLDVGRVLGPLSELTTIEEFSPAILEALAPVVASDIASLDEIDPDAGRASFVSRPADFPDTYPETVAAWPSVLHDHPVITWQHRTQRTDARRISDFISLAELHELDLYKKVYGPLGIEYQLAVGLPLKRPLVVGIALSRTGAMGDFTDEEVRFLDSLRPHLTQIYRTLQIRSRYEDAMGALARATGIGDDTVVLVSTTGVAANWPGANSDLVAWLSDQRARRHEHLLQPLVDYTEGNRLVARFVPGGPGKPDVVLLDEGRPELDGTQLARLGLSGREAEVLSLIARGQETKDAARNLGISPATIKKHLEHIYQKLGVSSRAAAVAQAYDAMTR